MNDKIINELENAGYDYAIAIATDAEIKAGAACGQLSLIVSGQDWAWVPLGIVFERKTICSSLKLKTIPRASGWR